MRPVTSATNLGFVILRRLVAQPATPVRSVWAAWGAPQKADRLRGLHPAAPARRPAAAGIHADAGRWEPEGQRSATSVLTCSPPIPAAWPLLAVGGCGA